MATEPESNVSHPFDLEALTLGVESFTVTETEPRKETTQLVSSGEASSSQAATAVPPIELTPLALKALEKEGTQVLVCSGSRRMIFCGSDAPVGNSTVRGTPVATPFDPDDIFADINPDYHMLFVQHEGSTIGYPRPTKTVVRIIKAMIAQSSRRKVKRKRKQMLEKEGGPCKKPNPKLSSDTNVPKDVDPCKKSNPKLPSAISVPKPVMQNNNSCLIVIKKVLEDIQLRPSYHRPIPEQEPKPSFEQLMEMAREREMGCSLQVVFTEWKLSVTALPALPLVPSLESHLPWFYLAESSQFNHIFGNMTTRQSFLVANSDLQPSCRLLYSKDGWLLLQGRELDLSSSRRSRRYPVFLLNPTTGVRMDLPSFSYSDGYAAFCTTSESNPGVIIYVRHLGRTMKIYMVRLGGASWEKHLYEFSRIVCRLRRVILCGSSVYCFFVGSILIFNLADLSWCYVTGGSLPGGCLSYFEFEPVEVEGKVVMVHHPKHLNAALLMDPAPFFRIKISGNKFEWEKITGHDEGFDGRIWFIHHLQSFCVKVAGSGHKMCWFARRALRGQSTFVGVAYALHCLNLTTQTHCRLTADSVICSQHAWVDLGCPSDHNLLDYGITIDDILPDL